MKMPYTKTVKGRFSNFFKIYFENRLTIVIVGVTLLIGSGLTVYGAKIYGDIIQLRQLEVEHFQKDRQLDSEFQKLQRAIGFGGFIHNVKEYLLYRKPYQLNILRANIDEAEAAYKEVRTALVEQGNAFTFITIDRFMSELRQKYELLADPRNHSLAPDKLDRLLNIERPETLIALISLDNIKDKRDRIRISKIKTQITKLIKDLMFSSILIPIVLAIGIYLAWLLSRSRIAETLLKISEERLSLHLK
ncbi:MAG: hypothetical protein V7740_15040, partial [Pseudomonas marincola]